MGSTAIISDRSPRRAEWLEVFGSDEVPIINIVSPNKANVLGEIRDVYMLDLDQMTDDQIDRLKKHLSTKFKIPMDEVERDLPQVGVPILAEDVIVSVSTDHIFFLLKNTVGVSDE